MCGRFTLRATLADVAAHFNIGVLPDWDWEARFNIAPSQRIAAVRVANDGSRECVRLQWGLIPSWAKDPRIGNRMINARAETVATKPSFRAAFQRRRCIVPADGYYEWQPGEHGKQPFLIELPDQPLFGIAGIWECWAPDGVQPIESVSLLTTDANEATRAVHHRMPVILRPQTYSQWLGETDTAPADLQRLLVPYDGDCSLRPVSKFVNRPGNDDPRCIASPATG